MIEVLPVKVLEPANTSVLGAVSVRPAPVTAPVVCVPAATLRAVLPRFTTALSRVVIEAVGPLSVAVPPLAVTMDAAPATVTDPPERVGKLAPAAKLVVPVPLRLLRFKLPL